MAWICIEISKEIPLNPNFEPVFLSVDVSEYLIVLIVETDVALSFLTLCSFAAALQAAPNPEEQLLTLRAEVVVLPNECVRLLVHVLTLERVVCR